MASPLPKYAKVNPQNPENWAQCDRCGFWRNGSDLVFQVQWAGMSMYSDSALVCADRCFDTPNEQLRTIVLPPDPPPVVDARVPNFSYEEFTTIQLQFSKTTHGLSPWSGGPQTQLTNQNGLEVITYQYPDIESL